MIRSLVIGFVLLICNASFAQNMEFGPKISILSSHLNLKENVFIARQASGQFGYSIGAFARKEVAGFHIQPEIYLTRTRSTLIVTGIGDLQYKFNRLDIPIIIGRDLGPIRIEVGPMANILLKAKSEDLSGFERNQNDVYNTLTFGYQAGFGMDLSNFVLSLRYEGQITKFANDDPLQIDSDQRQNSFVLSAGYKLSKN